MMWSEAIRLGAAVTEKITGQMFSEDRTGTCAIGAGLIACGAQWRKTKNPYFHGKYFMKLIERRGTLAKLKRIPTGKCPVCICSPRRNLYSAIAHLNDFHNWSREDIADWIVASGHDFEAIPEPVVTQSVHEAEQVPA